jgi:hypothetical protein
MNKNYFLILLISVFTFPLMAQSSGTLNVSVSTSHAGGNYKPRNVVAVWVENEQGDFLKTLLARADKRRTHLNTWQASTGAAGSEYNTVDAITGATYSNHGTRSCTWDGTDFHGDLQEDGTYYLWMELTDKNATGNFSSFAFQKGPEDQQWTPLDEDSFADIVLEWTADQASGVQGVVAKTSLIRTNPVNKRLEFLEKPSCQYRIINLQGSLIYNGEDQVVDLQNMVPGYYFIQMQDGRSDSFIKL